MHITCLISQPRTYKAEASKILYMLAQMSKKMTAFQNEFAKPLEGDRALANFLHHIKPILPTEKKHGNFVIPVRGFDQDDMHTWKFVNAPETIGSTYVTAKANANMNAKSKAPAPEPVKNARKAKAREVYNILHKSIALERTARARAAPPTKPVQRNATTTPSPATPAPIQDNSASLRYTPPLSPSEKALNAIASSSTLPTSTLSRKRGPDTDDWLYGSGSKKPRTSKPDSLTPQPGAAPSSFDHNKVFTNAFKVYFDFTRAQNPLSKEVANGGFTKRPSIVCPVSKMHPHPSKACASNTSISYAMAKTRKCVHDGDDEPETSRPTSRPRVEARAPSALFAIVEQFNKNLLSLGSKDASHYVSTATRLSTGAHHLNRHSKDDEVAKSG